MSNPTMTLLDFLLARIDEDESVARQAEVDLGRFDRENVANGGAYTGTQGAIVLLAMRDGNAMDPARILAECEAKRRIAETHGCDSIGATWLKCTTCADWDNADYDGPPYIDFPCPTLRALASVYADHPDYLEEWRA